MGRLRCRLLYRADALSNALTFRAVTASPTLTTSPASTLARISVRNAPAKKPVCSSSKVPAAKTVKARMAKEIWREVSTISRPGSQATIGFATKKYHAEIPGLQYETAKTNCRQDEYGLQQRRTASFSDTVPAQRVCTVSPKIRFSMENHRPDRSITPRGICRM